MFDVSMPHTTAPIGSLTGAMLGRSVRSTITSARLPGVNEPVMSARPGDPRAIDGRVADDVAGVEQVRDSALAGELEVEQRGVLHGDDGAHLGEDVAGREPLVADPKAGANAAVDELLHRRGAGPAGHVARRGERHRRRRRGDRVEIGVAEAGAMRQRDVGPQQATPAELGDLAARTLPRSRPGHGSAARRSRACAHRGGDRVELGLDEVGGGEGDRGVSGRRHVAIGPDENRPCPGIRMGGQCGLEMQRRRRRRRTSRPRW